MTDVGRELEWMLAARWLDKRGLADHLCCSVRSIQTALTEGLPHAVIFGRIKFQVAEVEPWLEAHGYLVRQGDEVGATLNPDIERPRTAQTAGARTRGVEPHAS